MSSFCNAKATHIFFSQKFQYICVSLDVNFNESLTNDIVSFEQLGPDIVFVLLFLDSPVKRGGPNLALANNSVSKAESSSPTY